MSSSNPKLVELEKGVDLLLEKVKALTSVVNNQEERIDLLTNELSAVSSEKANLESENIALMAKVQAQLNESVPPLLDPDAYNQKINELVKEINSCISLLST
ncbi:MAG: hypothetical protein AB8B72_12465 [Crocinitomicaceae bacterium]